MMDKDEWLIFDKKVRFGDCDAAGVIHFHNLLRWSHEFWEKSIENYGIPFSEIFPDSPNKQCIIFPIVHCDANFILPIKLGDSLKIKIVPSKVNNHLFQVDSIFLKNNLKLAEGKIIHCSIDSQTRKKVILPDSLERWIEASNLNNSLKECNQY